MESTAPQDSVENEQEKLRAQLREFLDKAVPGKDKNTHRYYKEKFGLHAKKIVDEVTTTKNTHIVKLNGGNPVTARMQWYQGCKYLREKIDPKYAANIQRVGSRHHGDFIEFYYKQFSEPDITAEGPIMAVPWKDDFIVWLDKEKEVGEKFAPQGVYLTPDDIEWGRNQLAGLDKYYLSEFAEKTVTVIRYDADAL